MHNYSDNNNDQFFSSISTSNHMDRVHCRCSTFFKPSNAPLYGHEKTNLVYM